MLRDCEAARWRLLSRGDLSAHEPDQTVTIGCAVNLGLLDAAGVSGGIATLPGLGARPDRHRGRAFVAR